MILALRAIAVAAILAGLAWAYHQWADHQREIGRQEIRAQWQTDRASIAEQSRLLVLARDKETARLQASVDKQREIDHAAKRALDRRVAGLLDSLRDRPERPADDKGGDGVPEVAGSGAAGPGNAGCTGAGLYGPDARFSLGVAADAARLQAALRSCRDAYGRAQAAAVSGG